MNLWLCSFPRSGNHFLRTVLHQAFGISSTTVYPREDGFMLEKPALAEKLGYAGPLASVDPAAPQWIGIKTHDTSVDDAPAIYVVRDGRAALVSYLHYLRAFTNKQPTIPELIGGAYWPGSWSEHYRHWSPRSRPNTLLLRFEDMRTDLDAACRTISDFLDVEQIAPAQIDIAEMRGIEPNLFRHGENSRNIDEMAGHMDLFDEHHREVMVECGYYA